MKDYVFVKEPSCILEQDDPDLERNYNCIVFSLNVPYHDIEPFQLTGSRISVSVLLGDLADKEFKHYEVGTVTDVMRNDKYKEDIGIHEVNDHLSYVYARIDPDAIESLQPFSFDSDDPNDEGWLNNFSVNKGKREDSAVIPIRNIEGYGIHPGMAEKSLANYWRIGWPPAEACVEYINRLGPENNPFEKERGIINAEGRTFRSDDLLTVTTIVKRKASPFTEEDVARESTKYGKPLKQIEIVNGLSKKYGLADEVRFS